MELKKTFMTSTRGGRYQSNHALNVLKLVGLFIFVERYNTALNVTREVVPDHHKELKTEDTPDSTCTSALWYVLKTVIVINLQTVP